MEAIEPAKCLPVPMSTTALETINHVIGGAQTAGSSTRTSPVYDPATGQVQRNVLLGTPADVDAAVRPPRAAFDDLGATRRSSAARGSCSPSASWSSSTRTSWRGSSPPSTARPSRTPRARSSAGMEVVEFACGIAELTKGEFSDQVSTDVDLHSFRQPLGVCAGITPFNFPIMVPMWMHPDRDRDREHVRAQAVRARPVASRTSIAELYAAGRAARRRVQRRARRQGGRRRAPRPPGRRGGLASSARRRSPSTSTSARRAHGKRVQALGGAKNHADRDARRRPRLRRRPADRRRATARPASAAWPSPSPSRSATPPTSWSRSSARKAPTVKVGPGLDPASEMGPVVTAAARDRVVGLHRPRRGRRGRRRPRARRSRATASSSARR